ncbi:MAG: haloacid dehalogenase-like hydrolase [Gammaproteobacteria bacterium AqS3]|nr:haloacid dehalogenase-like hydrolase [Gammaproteobacteria bacterium AqS3]
MNQPDQVPTPVSPSPDLNILVVDLDHSLVRTDLLAESFFSSLSRCWHIPLSALWALMRGGRPQLKQHLAAHSSINYDRLPYNTEVLDLVRLWKSKGARIVLATGSDHRCAQAVADHLEIFDEVYASDGKLNLSGHRKAEFLAGRYGSERFAYVGDHRRDLPVWRRSAAAITVGASHRLRRQVEGIPGIQVQHLKNPPA